MNTRTVLVKIDSVMDLTGEDADRVYERADCDSIFGSLLWVWNVAANPNGEIRDLRFWAREVVAPETTARLTLDQVTKMILPSERKQFHSGEVCFLLRLRRPSLKELRVELNGQLAANSSFFPREGLEKFLRTRWLGTSRSGAARAVAARRVA